MTFISSSVDFGQQFFENFFHVYSVITQRNTTWRCIDKNHENKATFVISANARKVHLVFRNPIHHYKKNKQPWPQKTPS